MQASVPQRVPDGRTRMGWTSTSPEVRIRTESMCDSIRLVPATDFALRSSPEHHRRWLRCAPSAIDDLTTISLILIRQYLIAIMNTTFRHPQECRREQGRPRARLCRRSHRCCWWWWTWRFFRGWFGRTLARSEAIRWHPTTTPMPTRSLMVHTTHLRTWRSHRHEEAKTHFPR